MDIVEYKALQINKIIKDSEAYKNYQNLKNNISNKYKLEENELKEIQQEIVNLAYNDLAAFELKKEEYHKKSDEFYNDPLIKKFIEAHRELQNMILDIRNIIETGV